MSGIRFCGGIFTAVVMSVLLLSSCTTTEVQNENNSVDMVTESISEEISSMPEEFSEESTEDASGTEAAVVSENKIVDGVILPPDEDFLRSIFAEYGGAVFTLDSSGNYAAYDEELYDDNYDRMMREYMEEILSEEYYEENKELFYDEVSSYEEYKAMMYDNWGEEIQGYLEYEPDEGEPLLYFAIDMYCHTDRDEPAVYSDEQIFIRSVYRLVERINEEPEIAEKITEHFENGKNFYAFAQVEYAGDDVITIDSFFTKNLLDDIYDESTFLLTEQVSADGRDGIVLNGVFVPADTERLLLSYSDQLTVETLADEIIPEDCVIVCNSYKMSERNDDLIYDLKDISEKLPELKELYLYMARATNTEYISEMKGLESLCYDALVPVDGEDYYNVADDTPFMDLPKLKNLWLYGDYTDYTFLNDMPGLENVFVSIDTWRKAETLPYDSVFDCPIVTGLEIGINNDLTGLKKLTNLQHLHLVHIMGNMGKNIPDLSPVKELKNLTCLEIDANDNDVGELSDIIGNPSKLENLELVRVKSTKDWSFLPELTSLKRLYLFEIPYISTNDIEQMPWLESLRYHDTKIDSSIYDKIPGLKNE